MRKRCQTNKKRMPNFYLKQERERRGWTHKDLADLIGLPDPPTIGRWERGTSFPSPRYRSELCRIFEKNAQELGLVPESPPTIPPPLASVFEQPFSHHQRFPNKQTIMLLSMVAGVSICSLVSLKLLQHFSLSLKSARWPRAWSICLTYHSASFQISGCSVPASTPISE